MTAQFHERISELDLTGRSFLTIHDYTPAEIEALLELAAELKGAQKAREAHELLKGRAVAMIS
jgi:ornithine carbamoyltransferase